MIMLRPRLALLLGLVLVLLAAAGISAYFTYGTASAGASSAPTSDALSRVSATGPPITLPANNSATKNLVNSGLRAVERIGAHGGLSFYRLDWDSGKTCYGVGVEASAWPLGSIKCTIADPSFPSPEKPLLDISIVEITKHDPTAHYRRVAGFAADGVAEVALEDESGGTITRVPVVNNVYWMLAPPGRAAVVAALDSTGNVLATSP
jgi:hypothetical protein